MGVGQHACPQVGVLGLGPIIIREDMSQGHFWGAPTTVPLCRVSRTRKSRSPWSMTNLLVSPFPSATLPWVNLPITEQASSLPSGNQTSVGLPKETIVSLTLRVFSKPDATRNTKSGVGAQPASAKCLPNQAGMTGRQVASNSLFWTAEKPVPKSPGRASLMGTRVIWWVGCQNHSK